MCSGLILLERIALILVAATFFFGTRSEWVELPKLNPTVDEGEGSLQPIRYIPPPKDPNSDVVGPDKSLSDKLENRGDVSWIEERKASDNVTKLHSYEIREIKDGTTTTKQRESSGGVSEISKKEAVPRKKPPKTTPWNRTSLWENAIATTSSPDNFSSPSDVPPKLQKETKSGNSTNLDPFIESLILQVHRSLIKNAGQPIKQKMHYLQGLQNNILNQMWKRSQRLWVVDGQSEARGHDALSFPSLEGALLTISFLTFAVFLIQIVRQFIQGTQGPNGTMIQVPVNLTTVRNRRHVLTTQALDILKMIDDFHLQHASHHKPL